MQRPALVLSRLIDLPRHKLFRCWAVPALITQLPHAVVLEALLAST